MTPINHFVDKVLDNSRAWLRIYERDKEEKRILEHREARVEPIPDATWKTCNKDWPYTLKQFMKQGDRQSYLHLSKILKYGIDQGDKYYCFADFYPPKPTSIILAILPQNGSKISIMGHKFGARVANPEPCLKRIKKRRLQRKFDLKKSLYHSWKVDLK